MKTRIITTTMVILFAAVTITNAANNRISNSSATSNCVTPSATETRNIVIENTLNESTILYEWVASRENWEQDNEQLGNDFNMNESAMLNEWIISRENWEQEAQEMTDNNVQNATSILEEWISGTENWEQN